jgi:hypothetical protein
MAALQYTNLGVPAFITGAVAPIYTNPGSTSTYLRGFIFHNTDTVSRTITVYEVPNSAGGVGTFAASEEFFKYTLQAGETIVFEITAGPGLTLTALNDTIQAICDVTNKVTAKCLGAIYA